MATTARNFFGQNPAAPDEYRGSVYVIPGGATLPSKPPGLLHQNSPNVLDQPEVEDEFAAQVVTGDFNGDRRADVVIGNPTESVDGVAKAGALTVLYGQSTAPYLGLIPNGANFITQNSGTIPGTVEAGDFFGASLTTGDFNGDGYADVAAGAPGEGVTVSGSTFGAAGAVWVLYGGAAGVRIDNSVLFSQASTDISGNPEKNDHFGSSLAAGDITGDGRDDLVINVEGENITGTTGAEGSVYVLKGSATGVTATGSTVVGVDTINVSGHLNTVAVGRFHGGSNADVVVYADRVKNGATDAGALVVLRGGSGGISATNVTLINQNSPNVSDGAEAGDKFGAALSVGDVDGDGADDLAVGVPGEDAGGGIGQGAVHVFLGGPSGLDSALDLFFTENHALIAANGQFDEQFGAAVRFLDVSNDGKPELLVTAPHEDWAYENGTMFVLGLARTSSSVALTGSTKLTRAVLGNISAYGPGAPIAGGVVPPVALPNVT
ncbi:FG-GAP repeat protein [Plantactinospora mayteni]|uniref:FG-GAP repeat protein n=1 Tax=Plantactinospora mayteni TaxID=566021 RepID=UPI001943D759|nr:FG-GAP repeat protein [Plantactinospora mayteni]